MTNKLLRILIIEDNIDHIELLSKVIERQFAPVDLHTVETIDDAKEFIEQTNYDIVIMDCYLNNTSIAEHIPHLRDKLGGVPIIVITGSGDEHLAADVIKKGASDYIVKTRDSLDKIPIVMNKYLKSGPTRIEKSYKNITPIQDKIMNEVASLGQQAKYLASTDINKVPDLKQLESLLEQIQRLKELATKLINK